MHPLSGTWIANVEKSRRHANHQFASATIVFEVGADQVVLSYDGINASGKREASTQTIRRVRSGDRVRPRLTWVG